MNHYNTVCFDRVYWSCVFTLIIGFSYWRTSTEVQLFKHCNTISEKVFNAIVITNSILQLLLLIFVVVSYILYKYYYHLNIELGSDAFRFVIHLNRRRLKHLQWYHVYAYYYLLHILSSIDDESNRKLECNIIIRRDQYKKCLR